MPDDHLPAGYLDDPAALAAALAGRLGDVAASIVGVDPQRAVEAEVRRFLTGRSPRLPGGLTDVLAARDLTDESVLRRRAGHPCVLIDAGPTTGSRSRCCSATARSTCRRRLRPAIERIRERSELRPADLADLLDEQSRLVLCRRLVREGLLETLL